MAANVLVYGGHAVPLPVLGGAATDADFVEPQDGLLCVAAGKLSVRIAGVWQTLTVDV